jgi:hypothetical protein
MKYAVGQEVMVTVEGKIAAYYDNFEIYVKDKNGSKHIIRTGGSAVIDIKQPVVSAGDVYDDNTGYKWIVMTRYGSAFFAKIACMEEYVQPDRFFSLYPAAVKITSV